MIVSRIFLRNACGLEDERTVELPSRGLVLVQGPNGSGKSSLFVDAPAVACWGQTVRGAPAWAADGSDGHARADVVVNGRSVEVERRRTKLKARLSFTPGGEDFDTATKAQPALQALVGDFATWRRTRVFSGEDAVRLSVASITDGQLKKLVESLLGANFEAALEICRKDLRQAERAANACELQLVDAEADVRAAKRVAAERERALVDVPVEEAPDVAKLQRRVSAMLTIEAELAADVELASDKLLRQERAWSKLDAELKLVERGACPTCARPFDVAARVPALKAAAEKERAAFLELQRACVALELERDEATKDAGAVEAELARARQKAAVLEERARHRARAEEELRVAEQALTDALGVLDAKSVEKQAAAANVALYTAAEQVLGLKGPRSRIVQHALLTVEAVANSWLAKLALGHMRVELQTGDTMRLEGAGGGHGYVAASRGERRRIDLALWLGLSELAPQYRGGTLLLDEPLDGLDAAGREAAVRAVEELSQTQCCVLITHDAELSRALEGRAVKKVEIAQ